MTSDADPTEPVLVRATPQTTAVIRDQVPVTQLADFFDRSFQRIVEVVGEQGVGVAGPALARYHGPPTDVADLEVGFPTSAPIIDAGNVVAGSLPGGQVARLVHQGSYDQLDASWGRLQGWIHEQGITPDHALWEVYVTEPSPEMDPNDLRTELNWLVAP